MAILVRDLFAQIELNIIVTTFAITGPAAKNNWLARTALLNGDILG